MVRTFSSIVFLSLVIAFNSHAHDSERLNLLEQEIQELKMRLSEIESSRSASSNNSLPAMAGEGWKSIKSWRSLRRGMRPNEVREILGEAHRIDGGYFTHWYYQNRGVVIFANEEVHKWEEPQQ